MSQNANYKVSFEKLLCPRQQRNVLKKLVVWLNNADRVNYLESLQ